MEIREGTSELSQVLYYGRSDPFDMEEGKVVNVIVRLKLKATPAATTPDTMMMGTGPGAQPIWIRTVKDTGFVASPQVEMVLTTNTGVKALISNLPSFPENEATETLALVKTATAAAPAEGYTSWLIDWNLNRGLQNKCLDAAECM